MYDTDSAVTIKINNEIKNESQEIFEALGLDIEKAVNIFLHQVIIHHGLPFKVVLEPNELTLRAMNEKFYGPFDNVEDLMRDLNA